MHVQALPMRWGWGDNYCYIVTDSSTNEGTIIDPAAPEEVLPTVMKLEGEGKLKLTSIINTHHHYDHSDGNPVFRKRYSDLPLYAGKDSPLVTDTPAEGNKFSIGQNLEVTAIHTPCHTRDSICWYFVDKAKGDKAVFTGDTLFTAGCGRFFEGDAADMLSSLSKIAKLPEETTVWPGHEYTRGNVRFAETVEPENQALKKLKDYAAKHEITAGAFTVKDELAFNPFMRTDVPDLQQKLGVASAVSAMKKLRQMKDRF